jgi:hypothetical protein
MLKISLIDSQHQRRVIVEGMLVAPWTGELASACERARTDLQGRELVVDLRGLTAIGPDGEDVLLQLLKDKVTLQCGIYMRELLRQLTRGSRRDQRELGDTRNDAESDPEGNGD